MTKSKTPSFRLDQDHWDNNYEIQTIEHMSLLHKVRLFLSRACDKVFHKHFN